MEITIKFNKNGENVRNLRAVDMNKEDIMKLINIELEPTGMQEIIINFARNDEKIKRLKVSYLSKEDIMTVLNTELEKIESIEEIEINEDTTQTSPFMNRFQTPKEIAKYTEQVGPLMNRFQTPEEMVEYIEQVRPIMDQLEPLEEKQKHKCTCEKCTCKKHLKVKDLKWLLSNVDEEAEITATTRYGNVGILLDVLGVSVSNGVWLDLDEIKDPITEEEIEKLQRKHEILEKIGYVIEEYYQNPQGLYQDVVKKQKSITPLKEVFQKEAFRMVFDTDFIRTDKFLSTFTSKHVDRKTIRTKIRRLIIKTAENMLDDEDLMLRLENSAMQALEDVFISTNPEMTKACGSSQFLSKQDLIDLSEKSGNDEE